MKRNKFFKSIELHKKGWDDISELLDLGFDFMEGKYKFGDIITKQFFSLMKTHYNKEGIGWIEWFIYESDYGNKEYKDLPTYKKDHEGKMILVEDEGYGYGAHDEDGNPICYSIQSLWEYLENNHLKNKTK